MPGGRGGPLGGVLGFLAPPPSPTAWAAHFGGLGSSRRPRVGRADGLESSLRLLGLADGLAALLSVLGLADALTCSGAALAETLSLSSVADVSASLSFPLSLSLTSTTASGLVVGAATAARASARGCFGLAGGPIEVSAGVACFGGATWPFGVGASWAFFTGGPFGMGPAFGQGFGVCCGSTVAACFLPGRAFAVSLGTTLCGLGSALPR